MARKGQDSQKDMDQDGRNRTTRTIMAYKTDRIWKLGYGNQNVETRIPQSEQDSMKGTVRTEQHEQDQQNRTFRPYILPPPLSISPSTIYLHPCFHLFLSNYHSDYSSNYLSICPFINPFICI